MGMFLKLISVGLLAISLLTACASAGPVVKKRLFWPPPPDEPKIEWLATYYNDSDLRGGTSLMRDLVGEQSELGFTSPLFIGGNSEDKIVVSDPGQSAFVVLDLNKKKFDVLGSSVMVGSTSKPTGVAFDGKGLIYAGDDRSCKVYVVNSENKVLKVLDLSSDVKSVGAFAIDKKLEHLIVPDANSHKVAIFSLDGKLLYSFGKKGGQDGEFNYPVGAALDSKGNIYISDSFNARVQCFSPEGVFISKFGMRGDGVGDFGIIKGLALDSEDHIYVVDARYSRMQVFNSKGEVLISIGAPYSQSQGETVVAGGFLLPQGIFIDAHDRIYVADMGNRRLQIFQYMNAIELKKYHLDKEPGGGVKTPVK